MCVTIPRDLAFANAFEKVDGGIETPFSWQQPPPMTNVPHDTIQEQPHRFTQDRSEGSDQRRPQNLRTASGSRPPRNVPMQPFYTMADQRVQGNSMPQSGARTSHNRLSSHGTHLRPVSDLRMLSPRCQRCLLMSPPADAYRGLFTFGVFNAIQSTCFDSVSLFIMHATPSF